MTFRSFASLDYRYDQTDVTVTGQTVTSFATVSAMVDRIHQAGFTGITMDMNAPVDIQTGRIDLWNERAGEGNRDGGLPDDFWRVVDYAHSKGLAVSLRPNIVDHHNDKHLTSATPWGPEFSYSTLFGELNTYFADLARTAQSHGVESMHIGSMNWGLVDQPQFQSQWQQLVNTVRGEFSGRLVHGFFYDAPSVLWNIVDEHVLVVHRTLSQTAMTDPAAIRAEYQVRDADTPQSVAEVIRQHDARYAQSIHLEHLTINAGDRVVGDSREIAGFFDTQTIDRDRYPVNREQQAARHVASIEFARDDMAGTVTGTVVDQYMPWQLADWLVDPKNVNRPWYVYSDLSFNVPRSAPAEKAIADALQGRPFDSSVGSLTVSAFNHAPTGSVAIQGRAQPGTVLTAVADLADRDGMGKLQYQWFSGGQAVAGARSSQYSVSASDLGKPITVSVSYLDLWGTQESVSSLAATQDTASVSTSPVAALPDINRVYLDFSDGVTRVRDLRRAPAIQAQEEDLLDLTGLAQELDLDLWWSGNRAPGRKEDATGAVWERGNVIYVSTDRDNQAEWWARVVGVRDLDQDDFWLG